MLLVGLDGFDASCRLDVGTLFSVDVARDGREESVDLMNDVECQAVFGPGVGLISPSTSLQMNKPAQPA